jgi:hypothetical protein
MSLAHSGISFSSATRRLRRRRREGIEALADHALLHGVAGQHLVQRGVELVDDGLGVAAGRTR